MIGRVISFTRVVEVQFCLVAEKTRKKGDFDLGVEKAKTSTHQANHKHETFKFFLEISLEPNRCLGSICFINGNYSLTYVITKPNSSLHKPFQNSAMW